MDYRHMREFHDECGAVVTVGVIRVPAQLAPGRYGVLATDEHARAVIAEVTPSPIWRLHALSCIMCVVPPDGFVQAAADLGFGLASEQYGECAGGKQFHVATFQLSPLDGG